MNCRNSGSEELVQPLPVLSQLPLLSHPGMGETLTVLLGRHRHGLGFTGGKSVSFLQCVRTLGSQTQNKHLMGGFNIEPFVSNWGKKGKEPWSTC